MKKPADTSEKKSPTRKGVANLGIVKKKRVVDIGIARRVSNRRLVEADVQSTRIPLAADRAVLYLEGMLSRVRVKSRRGHTDVPEMLVISVLEKQVLEESLALLKLKVAMQRGVLPVRIRES